MYIDSIEVRNFRNFRRTNAVFIHPDCDFKALNIPKPKLPNINLILGDNGLGKTSMMKVIALACLGPAVRDSGIYPYRLIRREPTPARTKQPQKARLDATFTPHPQDSVGTIHKIESSIEVSRRGDLESLAWRHREQKRWYPIFSEETDAFFFVGYGTARRVEADEQFSYTDRKGRSFARAQRVQSLFEETSLLSKLGMPSKNSPCG